MQVLDFMNENKDWRETLSNAPYNIIIKEDGDYVLLKYNQLSSDFTNLIVRECRGSIFRHDGEKWICVCRAFDKFGNYGESYIPEIDWASAKVMEKVDGSLMKLWYDKDEWHLSTNGTIDAFKAPLNGFDITFGDYFKKCLNCIWEEFIETLSEDCCYMFEMVGPMNRVVISYEKEKLYALGMRNMKTFEEKEYSGPLDEWCNIYLPKQFALSTLEDALKAAAAMSKDEEGFVVCDKYFNRVKIKSPEYLMAARLANNGVITRKRMLEIILEERIDDLLAYCPQYLDFYEEVLKDFEQLHKEIHKELFSVASLMDFVSKKDFAFFVKNKKYKDFLFKKYNNNELTISDYLKNQSVSMLLRMMEDLHDY